MKDCIFCKIVAGQIPCYKIYEDEYTLAFLDIAQDAVGHTLVIPKECYTNVFDCDEKTLAKVLNTVKRVSSHYVGGCGYTGVNIINANGKSAQQSVFHLHFHIIPRKEDDKIDMWPLKDKKEMNLASICEKLKIKQ